MGTDKRFADSFYISEKYSTSKINLGEPNLRSLINLDSVKGHEKFPSFVSEEGDLVQVDKLQIPSIVLEVSNDYVILNCLVDPERMNFQKRKFDIGPFKGKLDVIPGDGIIITIITSPGERNFYFQKDDSIKALIKEPEDRFSRFAGTSIFPPR